MSKRVLIDTLRFSNLRNGFTLIELLVAIAIVAIISVVAVSLFGNVQKSARDAKKLSDIENISKAYEANFIAGTGYQALTGAKFSSGAIPQPTAGLDYYNVVASDGSGFKVCAALEANPTNVCNTASSTCVCKESTLSSANLASTPVGTGSGMGWGGGGGGEGGGGGGGGLTHPTSCDVLGTLDDNLVAYWRLNEASWDNSCSVDTAMDATTNANNADSCPVGSGPTTPVSGKFSSAANLDGVDDYFNAGSAGILDNLSSTGLTLSAWISLNPLSTQSYIIMSKATSDTPSQGWKLQIAANRRMEFFADMGTTSSDSVFRTSSTLVAADSTTWNHIAVTWNGTNDLNGIKMYINGSEVSYINGRNGCNDGTPVPCTVVSDANQDVRIGSTPTMSATARLNGKIDDPRIYNRILSGSEISSLYNGGTGCIP